MPAGDGAKRGGHLSGLFGFQVVVDEDDERKWEGLCGEDIHGLFHVVVEYAEVGFLEVGDELAELIFHGDGKNDQVGVDAYFGLGVARSRGGRCRLALGGCLAP